MTGIALALITRVGGFFGLKLSEFWAGAIAVALLVAAIGVYGLKVYDAGFASAEGKCEAAALQSQIDAMKKDRDDARQAAADATLKLAAINAQAAVDKERTAQYVADLEKRPAPACALTCDDLRGMRIASKACPALPRSPAGYRPHVSGRRPANGAQ